MISPSTTWEIVDAQLDVFLSDKDEELEEGETAQDNYTVPQRIAAWNWAQRLLATHTPRQCAIDVTISVGGREAEVPSDFLQVWRVFHVDDECWLYPMQTPVPGSRRSVSSETDYFWTWGRRLYFEREVSQGDITLYYWAYWPEVRYRVNTDNSIDLIASEIAVPPWSILPLCHLTAATCLQPGAISAARIRNWNMRIDSGSPVQNARAVQAWEHRKWWRELLSSVPPVDMGSMYGRSG